MWPLLKQWSVYKRRRRIPDYMAKDCCGRLEFATEVVGLQRAFEKTLLPARW
jgi:hypothetical protein